MGPVDKKDVDDMKRLMDIMSSGNIADEPQNIHEAYSQPRSTVSPPAIATHPGTAGMKEILQRFYESTQESVERVVTTKAEQSPLLKEALETKRTSSGVQVGSWEIRVNEGSSGDKTYDVVNIHTDEPIAHDLSLYESALSLTKLLNRNAGINNPKVREVLELEENFTRQRTDAAQFKRKMTRMLKEGDDFRANVAEDRYEQCKQAAIALRSRLISICKNL
jgi:hypothetical protein